MKIGARYTRLAGFLALAALVAPTGASQDDHAQRIMQHRAARNQSLRNGALSPLGLVHREVIGTRTKLRIGHTPAADLRLPSRKAKAQPIELVADGAGKFAATGVGGGTVERLDGTAANRLDAASGPFRFGGFVLHFRPVGLAQGPVLDVYDAESPAKLQFRAIEFFPVSGAYRVQAQITPLPAPQKINLVDSHGFDRPYWIYGHLTFRLNGSDVRMEVYTPTLDWPAIQRDGFMLIFADRTSGKETYSAGRYLYIAGVRSGPVEVDFNKAYNPQCSFSAAYTCPFPRKENRLAVAIDAGEKTYTGPAATLLFSGGVKGKP